MAPQAPRAPAAAGAPPGDARWLWYEDSLALSKVLEINFGTAGRDDQKSFRKSVCYWPGSFISWMGWETF